MDSANLPSQTDLNGLYGAWNPMSYMQGQQNQDLAAQFRNQAFQANQNDVTRGALANDQSSQMNPLLVRQQDLTNTGLDLTNQGKGITNASAGIDLGQKQSLSPQDLEVKRADLQNRLGDEQYNNLSNTIQMSYLQALSSGKSDQVAQLQPMLEFLSGPTGSKIADRVQASRLGNARTAAGITEAGIGANASRDVGAMHLGGTMYSAQQSNAAKEYAATIGKGLEGRAAELGRMRDAETDPAQKAALDVAYNEAVRSRALIGPYGTNLDIKEATGFNREADSTKPKNLSTKDKRDAL